MTANPLTDQILASLATTRREQLPPSAFGDIEAFTRRIAAGLPAVAPDLIGQVLLHAASVYEAFATNDHRRPISTEASVAVRMLAESGVRLYLGGGREG